MIASVLICRKTRLCDANKRGDSDLNRVDVVLALHICIKANKIMKNGLHFMGLKNWRKVHLLHGTCTEAVLEEVNNGQFNYFSGNRSCDSLWI